MVNFQEPAEIHDVLGDREALAKAAERIGTVQRVEVTHGE